MAAVGGLDDEAAGDHRSPAPGLLTQPGMGRALLGLGESRRIHGKAGGEHLRQDDQVRPLRLLQQGFEVRVVGGAVVPGQGGLHQGQLEVGQGGQIAHSFSAA
ncbi:hypothetical protein D9M73_207360 [compost metagenome]